jgi:hypothetical protein
MMNGSVGGGPQFVIYVDIVTNFSHLEMSRDLHVAHCECTEGAFHPAAGGIQTRGGEDNK